MSKASRNKGKKGEREARELLADRDWILLANTADGVECEDMIATSPEGVIYSIEVKNTKLINIPKFRTQAMDNAAKKKLPWALLCKIDGHSSWLVLMRSCKPKIWHKKEV